MSRSPHPSPPRVLSALPALPAPPFGALPQGMFKRPMPIVRPFTPAPAKIVLTAAVIPTLYPPVHVALPKIRAGQIKVLGESLKERHPLFPDIPSLHEQGVSGYDVDLWIGVWAPPGLPADLLAKYNSEIRAIVALPEMREQLASQGLVPNTGTPQQFAKLVKEDFEKSGKGIPDVEINADIIEG